MEISKQLQPCLHSNGFVPKMCQSQPKRLSWLINTLLYREMTGGRYGERFWLILEVMNNLTKHLKENVL